MSAYLYQPSQLGGITASRLCRQAASHSSHLPELKAPIDPAKCITPYNLSQVPKPTSSSSLSGSQSQPSSQPTVGGRRSVDSLSRPAGQPSFPYVRRRRRRLRHSQGSSEAAGAADHFFVHTAEPHSISSKNTRASQTGSLLLAITS